MALKKKDYEDFEKARTQQLDTQLQESLVSRSDGKIDSLKHTILSYVSDADYDTAKSELGRYVSMQSEYPTFRVKSKRHIDHCNDVIQAIKAKRDFPGLHTLPMSKQQELMEKVVRHFEELKHYLHKIEVIEKDVKIDDLRSTVWVIRAAFYGLILVVFGYFLRYSALGMALSFNFIFDEYTDAIISWLFGLF